MKRLNIYMVAASVLIASSLFHGSITEAQTGSAPVQSSAQLALPEGTFPSDYVGSHSEAWTAAQADAGPFRQLHVKSYLDLGVMGAWYQYKTKFLSQSSGGFTFVAPLEIVYLGTYYPTAAKAAEAFADVVSGASASTPSLCSYGTQCLTYPINNADWVGKFQIIQQGNALAEILTDASTLVASQVTADVYTTNLNSVSEAFIRAVTSIAPTNTPVPATPQPTRTSTAVPTSVPTSVPTAVPTSTATSAPLPLFVTVQLGHRTVKEGSRQSVRVTTLPKVAVSIVIVFPDKNKKRHEGMSRQDGTLMWAFKQPAGHTSASRRTAKVTVTVSNGTGSRVRSTASYAIR